MTQFCNKICGVCDQCKKAWAEIAELETSLVEINPQEDQFVNEEDYQLETQGFDKRNRRTN